MKRRRVDSSVLRSIGYDEHGTLEVEFASGNVYRYLLVPRRVHDELLAAPSIGSYFNSHVRDVFRHVRSPDA